jgi:hypothetical protein
VEGNIVKKLFRPAKVDANQGEIVEALRAHGCEVLSLAPMGGGCPDLLVWTPYALGSGLRLKTGGQYLLFEVKDGDKPPSARDLTPSQKKFHAWWPGKIHIVNNVAEALRAAGVKEEE